MKNFRSLPHDQQKNTQDFYARVYDLVRLIPPGKVCTYGIIAEFLGAKSSSRMVGWALNCVIDRIDIPCHRVVNRNGVAAVVPNDVLFRNWGSVYSRCRRCTVEL